MQELSISRNKFGVRILEQYFADPVSKQETVDQRYDLIVSYCTDTPEVHNRRVYTSLIDLQKPEQVIFNGFSKKYRSDIRTACKRFVASITASPQCEAIGYFCKVYDEFAEAKKLVPCNEQKLKLFARHGRLIISQINRPDDNVLLCTHAYIHDGERIRLLYSVSRFRELGQDSKTRNQMGKAHRYLHWSDMKQFKSWGFSDYDLGGIVMNGSGELENVNSFKKGFGGTIQQEFVNAYPQSIRGWLAMKYLLRQL